MYRKVYIRGGEHPPRHQQALPLRHPIPITLPPRFRGFGECFEPRQTKPAGSGELGRFPQLQGLGGTGQPEQWGSPPPPVLLPAAIILARSPAPKLGDEELAGMRFGGKVLASRSHRCPHGPPGLGTKHLPTRGHPRGVCTRKGGGDRLCPHPTQHPAPSSRWSRIPAGWIRPCGEQVRFRRAGGFGKGLAELCCHHSPSGTAGGVPCPPLFPLDPLPPLQKKKVLSGRAKPWKVLSPRPA